MSDLRLSRPATVALWVAAAMFLVVGLAAFFLPGWAAEQFPWTVSPFLAQTIGGWSLGTAGTAILAARFGRWRVVFPMLVYLGAFGIGQLIVVVAFLDRLQTTHALTYPYLFGLVALIGSLAFGIADFMRRRPSLASTGETAPSWGRAFAVAVAGFVLFLAVGTLFAGPNGATANGDVFPEQMSLFSIRAFSAFLLAVSLSVWAVLPSRWVAPYLALGMAAMCIVVPITLAALLNVARFDFVARPGGLVYIVAYVIVGAVIALVLAYYARSKPDAIDFVSS
jgi:hypothetical protein